jgi:hypothetical protein
MSEAVLRQDMEFETAGAVFVSLLRLVLRIAPHLRALNACVPRSSIVRTRPMEVSMLLIAQITVPVLVAVAALAIGYTVTDRDMDGY